MKVLFCVGHPAHVHLFKNPAKLLEARGHDVEFAARDRDECIALLDSLDIRYHLHGRNRKGFAAKALGMLKDDLRLAEIIRGTRPDLVMGVSGIYAPHASALCGVPSVVFTDNDDATLTNRLSFPFCDFVCTPSHYSAPVPPRKHITYEGFHELAYLADKYFKPDLSVLNDIGVSGEERFAVLRLSSWDASHDTRQHGLSKPGGRDRDFEGMLVRTLERHLKVIVSSELHRAERRSSVGGCRKITGRGDSSAARVPQDRAGNRPQAVFRQPPPVEKFHSLLYYADLYVGDGHKSAAEAAILGTPSVLVSSRRTRLGNIRALEDRFGLLESFDDPMEAISRCEEIALRSDLKSERRKRAERIRKTSCDMVEFIVQLVEGFPDSARQLAGGSGAIAECGIRSVKSEV